jgi:alkanesulfonate monooxygenase SsuD/methylene tetrahydromethanopterin reductase-like flavin-dependent oxidoreductase (luciferase family)
MHVGMSANFQRPGGNDGDPNQDASLYESEYRLADRAEILGFDSLWSVEHHLDGIPRLKALGPN